MKHKTAAHIGGAFGPANNGSFSGMNAARDMVVLATQDAEVVYVGTNRGVFAYQPDL